MRALLLLVLVLVFAGCKSADELYNEGQRLEMDGDYEAAVRYYADALEKQPNLEKARGRLLEAGRSAAKGYLADLDAAEADGAWVEAGEIHLALDGLVGVVDRSGVVLPMADDYETRRAANFEAAITALLDEGDALVERGAFGSALAGYDRARRFRPTPDDEAALADATLDAYAGWAAFDLAAGRFRAAYDHAGQALAFLPPGSLAAAELVGLQNRALERGTVRTAATPLRSSLGGARGLPRGFLAMLDDALILDHWTQPPPFVAVLEPALVRRALRDLNLDRDVLGAPAAARVGQHLEVDVVFTGEVEGFQRTVEERGREDVTQRTRSGDRATYQRIEEDVTLSATVTFGVVEAASRESLCGREIERSVHARITRGEYGGPIRTLGLGREERELFDQEVLAERERDLEQQLADDLARRVAELAFDCILRQVP